MLKASYDPGWKVTVDGQPAATEMVAPALVGVTVSPGFHTVVFTYVGYSYYPLLFGVALVTLVGVGIGWIRWRRALARLTRRKGVRRDDTISDSEGGTPKVANSS